MTRKSPRKVSQLKPEKAHDILRRARGHPMERVFSPRNVALIGASDAEGSVGRTTFENLTGGSFAGTIYPVNPKRKEVLGHKAYPSISCVPEGVDLAVIVTPAEAVPGIVAECVSAGVKGAVIISAGFKETGAEGALLEQQIYEVARGKMRIIGPNCLGIMRPHSGLNATFAAGMALPGSVGFISQSGALCAAILGWSRRENVGFSTFASLGSMLDVGWGDLIYFLGDDPFTKSIVIYMESIGDARSFLSAAREVALTKPIIVIKVGRTSQAAKAAASHTGSMTGSDEVLEAAFRRAGVLRVNTISELFAMSEVLAKQSRPAGPRLAIVTNAGGPGALATDMLVSNGGQLAELSPESLGELNALLPPHWSHNNPIDILGDAPADRYAKAVEIVSRDPNNDGVLVILTAQATTEPTATAEKLKPFAKIPGKPILASWMGGPEVAGGEDLLNSYSIPSFSYPDSAAKAFNYMWRYSYNLRGLYETPVLLEDFVKGKIDKMRAEEVIKTARNERRTILSEYESKDLLQAYGIPTVETRIALSTDQAVQMAEHLGFPVVLKLHSKTITHKTDVGGVKLNLRDQSEVREAWAAIENSVWKELGSEHFQGVTVQPMVENQDACELILGSSIDPQFGPVLLFGMGGEMVEIFKDRALGLPPLNATLARRMMEHTHIYEVLKGVRGRAPVDMGKLEQLVVRFSTLVVEQPWIAEIEINPLLASPEGLMALDARVVLHGPEITEEALPKLAVRPYPTQYVSVWTLTDGTPVALRPIRPEDEPLMAKFHSTLSERSVHYRYFGQLHLSHRIAHERLTRICFNDYDREIALVVDYLDPETGEHEILGVGRLSKMHGTNEAEFAIVVSDEWQGMGLGTRLLTELVEIGRAEKIGRITARILPENHEMQTISRKVGFTIQRDEAEEELVAELIT